MIINKIVIAIIKRIGSFKQKQIVWDKEFNDGNWDFLKNTKNDQIYDFIYKYVNSGYILDLGCGLGNTCYELNNITYTGYTGVDISKKAIDIAKSRNSIDNENKNKFIVGNISDFKPDRSYDVILFRESIYYIQCRIVKSVLNEYVKYLKKEGVIIVRIHDRVKYKKIVNIIIKYFKIVEIFKPNISNAAVIVFK